MKIITLALIAGCMITGLPTASKAEIYWESETQAIPAVPSRYVDLLYSPVTAARKIGVLQRQGEEDPKVQIGQWTFAYDRFEGYVYGISKEYDWQYSKAVCIYRRSSEGAGGYDIYYRFYRPDQTWTAMHLSISATGSTPNFFATGTDVPDPGSLITRELDRLTDWFLLSSDR